MDFRSEWLKNTRADVQSNEYSGCRRKGPKGTDCAAQIDIRSLECTLRRVASPPINSPLGLLLLPALIARPPQFQLEKLLLAA